MFCNALIAQNCAWLFLGLGAMPKSVAASSRGAAPSSSGGVRVKQSVLKKPAPVVNVRGKASLAKAIGR